MEPENTPLECVVVANLRVSAWLNRAHGIFAPLAAMAEIAMVSCLDLGGSGGSRMGLLNGPLNYDRENGKTKTTLYISQKTTPHPKIPKKPVKLMAKFLPYFFLGGGREVSCFWVILPLFVKSTDVQPTWALSSGGLPGSRASQDAG